MHPSLRQLSCVLLLSSAVCAHAMTDKAIASVERACKAGKDQKSRRWIKGDTASQTNQITGVTIVSVTEAKCLMDHFRDQLVLIHSGKDTSWQVPGTKYFNPYRGEDGVELRKLHEAQLLQFAGGDRSHPVMFYGEDFNSFDTILDAADAGEMYKWPKVYWMRFGIADWRQAGYEVEPGQPGGQPSRAEAERKSSIASLKRIFKEVEAEHAAASNKGATSTSAASTIAPAAATSTAAPQGARPATVSPEVVGKTEPRSDSYYAKANLDIIEPPALSEILRKARSVRSLSDTCGEFDASTMPDNQEELVEVKRRLASFIACAERFRGQDTPDINVVYFESATSLLTDTKAHTCSRSSEKDCIPDAAWRRSGDIATPGNLSIVKAASARVDGRRGEVNAAAGKVNRYQYLVKEHVEEINARQAQVQQQSAPSYQAPSYQAPPPFTPPPASVLYPYRNPRTR